MADPEALMGWRRQGGAFDRRAFIKRCGVVAALVPVVESGSKSDASAQTSGPQRFLAIYHPHGAASPLFRRRPGETESEFDLRYPGAVLEPFDDPVAYGESFKNRITVLDGFDFSAAIESGRQGHDGPPCLLTGSSMTLAGAANASLDYHLAVERGLGTSTPFAHLVLGVGDDSNAANLGISFGAAGTVLPKSIDPRAIFERVFAAVVVGEDPVALARVEAEREAGRSVLDYLVGDLERLVPRLGATERWKLDQHLSSLREMEQRLSAFENACEVPPSPPALAALRTWNGGEPYFDQITNLMIDLLAQAVACDLTRFGSLWLADLSRGAIAGTGIDAYLGIEDVHNEVAHQYFPPGANGSAGSPASWELLGHQQRYSYGKCARLMQRLSQHGVLDDTVILVGSDMGDPAAHDCRAVPMVLGGGGGGRLRMGKYFEVSPGISNNKILVSIAQAFGVQSSSFGTALDPAIVEGAFTPLLA